jgi:hypothetical protein
LTTYSWPPGSVWFLELSRPRASLSGAGATLFGRRGPAEDHRHDGDEEEDLHHGIASLRMFRATAVIGVCPNGCQQHNPVSPLQQPLALTFLHPHLPPHRPVCHASGRLRDVPPPDTHEMHRRDGGRRLALPATIFRPERSFFCVCLAWCASVCIQGIVPRHAETCPAIRRARTGLPSRRCTKREDPRTPLAIFPWAPRRQGDCGRNGDADGTGLSSSPKPY